MSPRGLVYARPYDHQYPAVDAFTVVEHQGKTLRILLQVTCSDHKVLSGPMQFEKLSKLSQESLDQVVLMYVVPPGVYNRFRVIFKAPRAQNADYARAMTIPRYKMKLGDPRRVCR